MWLDKKEEDKSIKKPKLKKNLGSVISLSKKVEDQKEKERIELLRHIIENEKSF